MSDTSGSRRHEIIDAEVVSEVRNGVETLFPDGPLPSVATRRVRESGVTYDYSPWHQVAPSAGPTPGADRPGAGSGSWAFSFSELGGRAQPTTLQSSRPMPRPPVATASAPRFAAPQSQSTRLGTGTVYKSARTIGTPATPRPSGSRARLAGTVRRGFAAITPEMPTGLRTAVGAVQARIGEFATDLDGLTLSREYSGIRPASLKEMGRLAISFARDLLSSIGSLPSVQRTKNEILSVAGKAASVANKVADSWDETTKVMADEAKARAKKIDAIATESYTLVTSAEVLALNAVSKWVAGKLASKTGGVQASYSGRHRSA